jgi:hypothetical protein
MTDSPALAIVPAGTQCFAPEVEALAGPGPPRYNVDRLTAMAPAPPRKMKVAGALAVPLPDPPPIGEGEVERAPGAAFTVKPRPPVFVQPESKASALDRQHQG